MTSVKTTTGESNKDSFLKKGCVIEVDECKYTILVASPPTSNSFSTDPFTKNGSLTVIKSNLTKLDSEDQDIPPIESSRPSTLTTPPPISTTLSPTLSKSQRRVSDSSAPVSPNKDQTLPSIHTTSNSQSSIGKNISTTTVTLKNKNASIQKLNFKTLTSVFEQKLQTNQTKPSISSKKLNFDKSNKNIFLQHKTPSPKPLEMNSPPKLPVETCHSTTSTPSELSPLSLNITETCTKLKRTLKKFKKMEKGTVKVDVEEIIENLQSALSLVDAMRNEDLRKTLLGDEDEFSRVETETVPPEVKQWLSLTFTHSNQKISNKGSRKKFRSVANCIRAGLLVDKMFRRMSAQTQPSSKISDHLKKLDEWSFDVFALNEDCDNQALKVIGLELLQRFDLTTKFKINVGLLEAFYVKLQEGYGKFNNPYHNAAHGADVAQTVYGLLSTSGLSVWLSEVEILATLIACLAHDFEHTGTTNNFHINTESELALVYNDKSVLENYHLTATFRLLRDKQTNPFNNLSPEEYKEFRNIMIQVVLATDMSNHFIHMKNMKTQITNAKDEIEKVECLSMIVHAADISHPAKKWHVHHRWTDMVIEEFFKQGDKEAALGLPISPLCDRKTTLVADSQIGFIDFIVSPTMNMLGDTIDKMLQVFNKDNNKEKNHDNKNENNNEKPSEVDDRKNSLVTTSSQDSDITSPKPWEECLVENRKIWKERSVSGWVCPLQISQ